MSGGEYDHGYYHVQELADNIERDFINDGKYMDDDYDTDMGFSYGKRPQKEHDRIGDATPEERVLILAEIKSLIIDLKRCAKRAKELEWYMSGDTGATTYLECLNDDD